MIVSRSVEKAKKMQGFGSLTPHGNHFSKGK